MVNGYNRFTVNGSGLMVNYGSWLTVHDYDAGRAME